MTTVVVCPYRTLKFLEGGGHFWVYLQYVHGLQQAGCDVYWLERVPEGPWREQSRIETWLHRLKRYGLDGKVIVYTDGPHDYLVSTRSEAHQVFNRADLLLNFHYAIDPELLACFRRTALVDIDPGLLQTWMSTGQLSVAAHDRYFTIGETVGTPSARFPDCGLDWVRIRPPVCLDLWPYIHDPRCEAFTTVTDWWSGFATDLVDGREVLYDNNKRVSFLAFAELPGLTSQPLELAVYMAAGDAADRRMMERHGWRIRHSLEVSSTPETYRSYIQRSRGEISCVKPSYVRLQNGWISDRSLCYLASGKPVVVQRTGLRSYLSAGGGIFEFSSAAEAAEALATVNADYERHCRSAREIAETFFDARRTTERILDVALR
jgi:glycosyltransferase involved in cell wall biosynthesis